MTEQGKREWVIEGLEFTLEESGWDANAAYDQELMIQVVTEAIALLKAQEPIAPIERNGFFYCGECRYAFTVHRQKYCTDCGRAVKWK